MSDKELEGFEENTTQPTVNEAEDFLEETIVEEPVVVQEEDKPDPTEEKPPFKPARISKPINKGKEAGTYKVALPSDVLENFVTALSRFSEMFTEKNEELEKWKAVSEEAVEFYTPAGIYQDRLDDQESDWEQGVRNTSDEIVSQSSVSFKPQEGELKGEIALLKAAKLLGLGDVVRVQLPHSGIWVTLKPPTDRDLINFYNTVFREKVMLGTATSGLSFSNFSVHINNRLFEFILKHVHNLNYSDMPKDQLGNYMVIHDFPFLVHGFAKAMYPNGFDYRRACVTDLGSCSHISEQTIDLDTMTYIDNKSLSQIQRNILSNNRANSATMEAYRTFKAEHARLVPGSHRLSNGVKFNFKIPTFNEYTSDGIAWITNLSNVVDNLTAVNQSTDEQKQEILNQYLKTTILRQFNHFIESIELDDKETVTDRETINGMLEIFSSDDDIRDELSKAIIDFKVKTTYGVIGIDQYTCPACNREQIGCETLPVFKRVIPLDSVNLFFLMLTSKISKILERDI